MGAINAPGHVRELVISQRHIYRRDLRQLLDPLYPIHNLNSYIKSILGGSKEVFWE